MNLDRAIEDYLAYLHVERGLADATIRAYRSDLTDFRRNVLTHLIEVPYGTTVTYKQLAAAAGTKAIRAAGSACPRG